MGMWRASHLALCAVASWYGARPAGAQASALPAQASVSGRVFSVEGLPLPGAIVTLNPGRADSVQGLTDREGRFRLAAYTMDPLVVRARAIGFRPDSTRARAGDDVELRLALLPRVLNASVVRGIQCTREDQRRLEADSGLQSLLTQARLNAEQLRLATMQLPFLLQMSHRMDLVRPNGDTTRVERKSFAGPELGGSAYKRGRMLFKLKDKWYVVVPMAGELSRPAFLDAHCAVYQGLVEMNGEQLHHVALAPRREIRTPDLAGDLYLDKVTYVLRRADYRLVNVERSGSDVTAMDLAIVFDRHPTGLVLPIFMTAEQSLKGKPKDPNEPIARFDRYEYGDPIFRSDVKPDLLPKFELLLRGVGRP